METPPTNRGGDSAEHHPTKLNANSPPYNKPRTRFIPDDIARLYDTCQRMSISWKDKPAREHMVDRLSSHYGVDMTVFVHGSAEMACPDWDLLRFPIRIMPPGPKFRHDYSEDVRLWARKVLYTALYDVHPSVLNAINRGDFDPIAVQHYRSRSIMSLRQAVSNYLGWCYRALSINPSGYINPGPFGNRYQKQVCAAFPQLLFSSLFDVGRGKDYCADSAHYGEDPVILDWKTGIVGPGLAFDSHIIYGGELRTLICPNLGDANSTAFILLLCALALFTPGVCDRWPISATKTRRVLLFLSLPQPWEFDAGLEPIDGGGD